MKRILKNVILSSVLTLVLYLLLAVVLLGGIENQDVRFFISSFVTVTISASVLFYFQKCRKGIGEEELLSDYKKDRYDWQKEILFIWQRERSVVFFLFLIAVISFFANMMDHMILKMKLLSMITMVLFGPFTMLSSVIEIPFLGYTLSVFWASVVYLLFVFLDRKRRYAYWMKK